MKPELKVHVGVPKYLRISFIIHFLVDISVAIPLFIMPVAILSFFGWPVIDPVLTRLFAAALFGIGIESFLGRNADPETFDNMLNLKIIWSFFAVLGISLSILQNPALNNILSWIGLVTFLSFNFLWVYFKLLLYKQKRNT